MNALAATTHRTVLQCKEALQTFLRKLKKFEKGSNNSALASQVSLATSKIKWATQTRDELAKFRAEIIAYTASLNMLLLTTSM
jgi:hypothetical protein